MDSEPSSCLLLVDIREPFDFALLIPLAILVLLSMGSALVSGSEVAFFSLRPRDIESIKNNHKHIYESLVDLLGRPNTLLATILIANNFFNIGIVIISSYLISEFFDFRATPTLWFLIQIVAITFLILLFGEVLPKVYANRRAMSFSTLMSRPMFLLRSFLKPLSLLLVRSTTFIENRLQSRAQNLSINDLSQALELTNNKDTPDDEREILEGIVKFGSTNVKQIMSPRIDMVYVHESWNYLKVLDIILDSGYSRIPVYDENYDKVKGILYIKDLLPYIRARSDFKWLELIREPFFVPENKKIDDLLKEFQERKIHLAIIVDEFGSISGIITLEDIIEEIVGEISDEFDNEEFAYSKLDEDIYVFEGKIHLKDFFKVLKIDQKLFAGSINDADTLAGFLLEIASRFLEKDEEIIFKNCLFKVESLEGRRIKRVKVSIIKKAEDEMGKG